jgi:hypothetical protein
LLKFWPEEELRSRRNSLRKRSFTIRPFHPPFTLFVSRSYSPQHSNIGAKITMNSGIHEDMKLVEKSEHNQRDAMDQGEHNSGIDATNVAVHKKSESEENESAAAAEIGNDDSEDDSGSDDDVAELGGLGEEQAEQNTSGSGNAEEGGAEGSDKLRQKKEQRLAMNRASARERRRRKRVLLERLEARVLELTKEVQTLQEVNDGLHSHISKLETELAKSHAVIASLSATTRHGPPSVLDALSRAGVERQQAQLRSLLLRGAGGLGDFLVPIGGAGPARLSDALAEHQMLLDLQAQRHNHNLLHEGFVSGALAGVNPAQRVAPLAGLGAAGAGRGSLLGRMNFLNAINDNSVSLVPWHESPVSVEFLH